MVDQASPIDAFVANMNTRHAQAYLDSTTLFLVHLLGSAQNFVNMEVIDPTDGSKYVLTIQRVAGKSPAEAILELKARVAALTEENNKLHAAIRDVLDPTT